MMAFVEAILEESEISKNFLEQYEILIFPLLNPDGVENGNWRHNANGMDLNRDWQNFEQPETRAVRDWVSGWRKKNPEKEFHFGIDFHTSYSGPYLLTLGTLPHRVKPIITHEWVQRIEALTKDSLDIRPRPQDLPYCYNWFINDLGMEGVTYEEGDEIDRGQVRKRAKDYARVLMEILLEKSAVR